MSEELYIGKGDQLPLLFVLERDGKPVDLAGSSVEFKLTNDVGETLLDWTAADEVQPTFAVTFGGGLMKAIAHKAANGDQVKLTTAGSLPSGLSTSVRYFIRDASPNDVKLTERPSGSPLAIASAGSGSHQAAIVGSVTIVVPSSVVAGVYRLWLRIAGSNQETFGHPNGVALRVAG